MAMDLDDDHSELKKLNLEVFEDSDNFETWEKLVRTAESLDGGINRNSSPQSIAAMREVYDRFLAKFPLFFGYWKKYADLEFAIAGTEAAELIYERGVASISSSVDLWAQYCSFKVETSHDPDVIRELFERGSNCVGLDFLAHPFWDKFIEFEERQEALDRIFIILHRIVTIPLHQYARYFERFRQLSQTRPLSELVVSNKLAQYRSELEQEAGAEGKEEMEMERDLRVRIDAHYLEVFQKCQAETTKRWTYEQEVKRPYFHVTELDDAQLTNWRKYLDFEESEGDYSRIAFLYERCLVAAAYYDEFWLRYGRWMFGQEDKTEEVRNILQRASCLYAPIARPAVRLQWALFEEMQNRVDVSHAIYEAILFTMPGHIETIIAWANSARRHSNIDAAIAVYKAQIESPETEPSSKAALLAEWARLLWKIKGSAKEARTLFKQNQQVYLDSRPFWSSYLTFEIEQPTNQKSEPAQHELIKQVFEDIRRNSRLSNDTITELAHTYMAYLLERSAKDSAKEYMQLDREINN